MIGVGKNWKREFQIGCELPALVLIVNADRNNLGSGSSKFVIIFGQTGQLLSAIRSPVAAIEHEHYFGLAGVILQCNACPLC